MVFVEPFHIFLGEMIADQDDRLVFELRSLPGGNEVTISVVTLFTLTSEISANLFGHILWENVRRVDGRVTEVNIPKSFISLAAVSTFTPPRGFFCLSRPEGLSLFVSGVVGLRLPPLRCSGMKVVLEVGQDAPSAMEFFTFFLGLLAWVLFQGLMV
jgi:hypothetical protein